MNPEQTERLSFSRGVPAFPVERAEGAYLYTPDGRRILDAGGGAIVVNVGHGRGEIAQAAAASLARIGYVVPPFATPERVRLAERLVDRWLPPGLDRVYFAAGGSEAVDAAIRLARQHHVASGRPERWKVAALDISYHGMTLATLAAGGHARRRAGFEPLLLDFPKVPTQQNLRCPEQVHDGCGKRYAAELERVIEREGAETIAAFIAEPVSGASGGAEVPPPGWWPAVADICRRHAILLIADEVMTGFGRTGRRFGVEHWDVAPDILVSGKGLSGGYAPIVGLFVRSEVVAPLAERGMDFMFFTYSNHSASCAIADTALDILEREDLVARAEKMGDLLGSALAELEQLPNVAQVRGLGMLWGVELVSAKETLEPFPADVHLAARVTQAGLERGAFFYPAGSGRPQDALLIGPPFVVEPDDVDRLVSILADSITAAVAT